MRSWKNRKPAVSMTGAKQANLVSAALLACLLASGCGQHAPAAYPPPPLPAEDPSKVSWTYAPNAISLEIEVPHDLNAENGRPLAITLRIMQLKDASSVKTAAYAPGGIDRLIRGISDPPDIVASTLKSLQPGGSMELVLDREDGARWLAVAAGFGHLRPGDCFASMPLPLHESTEGFIFRTRKYSAADIRAEIRLDGSSVHITGGERVR